MAKAPITNRVKGKMWTDTMTIEFDGNIAGAVDTCFRALKVEHMEGVLKNLNEIYEARTAHANGIFGYNPSLIVIDVKEDTQS